MPKFGTRRAASRDGRFTFRDVAMLYLSQLLGMPVEDMNGQRIGKVSDLIVLPAEQKQEGPTYPSALVIEGQADQSPDKSGTYLPIQMVEWKETALRLRVPLEQVPNQPEPSAGAILSLAHDVLDKQVIDIVRKKAVRVNDVCLGDDWHILGIDNSTLGLVRRLAPNWLLGTNVRRSPTNLIPWEHVELISSQQPEEEAESPAAILPGEQVTNQQAG